MYKFPENPNGANALQDVSTKRHEMVSVRFVSFYKLISTEQQKTLMLRAGVCILQ